MLKPSDGFPSTEVFIEDIEGMRVFLGVHKEQGDILTLYGGTSENIFNFEVKLKINDKGIFESIYSGNNLVNIDTYNKKIQKTFN